MSLTAISASKVPAPLTTRALFDARCCCVTCPAASINDPLADPASLSVPRSARPVVVSGESARPFSSLSTILPSGKKPVPCICKISPEGTVLLPLTEMAGAFEFPSTTLVPLMTRTIITAISGRIHFAVFLAINLAAKP